MGKAKEHQWVQRDNPTPKKKSCLKPSSGPYREHLCEECDARQVADEAEGMMVCPECGICERMLVSDGIGFDNVDWGGQTVISKSEHVPKQCCTNLIKKYDVGYRLVPELTARYKAALFWSQRNMPAGRKSCPSYVRKLLLAVAAF